MPKRAITNCLTVTIRLQRFNLSKLSIRTIHSNISPFANQSDNQYHPIMAAKPVTEQQVSTEISSLLASDDYQKKSLSVVVIGASGHLARTQVIPGIFTLFTKEVLPKNFHLIGYARSEMDDKSFRGDTLNDGLKGHVSDVKGEHSMSTAKSDDDDTSAVKQLLSMIGLRKHASNEVTESDRSLRKQFLNKCYYVQGAYDKTEAFEKLNKRLEELEDEDHKNNGTNGANRIFYLAIPPPQFESTLSGIHSACRSKKGWSRVIIEKPFGEDLESARKLNQVVASKFEESEVFRIDHFMGQETLLNVIPFRFSNLLYSTVWNREYIDSIIINVKESFGLEGRAGYFEDSGILRDMIQNHLLSMAALCTMEEPTFNNDEAWNQAKTTLFKSMQPVKVEDTVFGQYSASPDGKKVGYLQEEGVAKDSKTPTFVSLVVKIDNDRWRDVPILLHCGKALDETKTEMIINFKANTKSALYAKAQPNRLVLRVKPDPSIHQTINTKEPGLANAPASTQLILVPKSAHQLETVPEPYERLVFDVIRGSHQLFVSAAEAEAAWKVVDEMTKQYEGSHAQPIIYQFGSHGPAEAQQLMSKYKLPLKLEEL